MCKTRVISTDVVRHLHTDKHARAIQRKKIKLFYNYVQFELGETKFVSPRIYVCSLTFLNVPLNQCLPKSAMHCMKWSAMLTKSKKTLHLKGNDWMEFIFQSIYLFTYTTSRMLLFLSMIFDHILPG